LKGSPSPEDLHQLLIAEPLELIEFLNQIFEALIDPTKKMKRIKKLSQLMNIESSRVEDISMDQRFENLSVVKKDDPEDNKDAKHQAESSMYDNSQMTSNRSHFTSIDGPPKVYEEIMRQLEADIRKHIRIEH
jgi:hypothetical protein